MSARRFFLRILAAAALCSPLPLHAAYGESDADQIFNSFNNAFYVGNNGQAYYRETTAGGRAWFWTQANIIEMVADTNDRAPSQGRRDMLSALCNGFMDFHGQDWTWNEYNDDVLWACIVFAKAYQATGNTVYRERSIANFNMVWNRAWSTHLGGGLFWRTDNQTKNTCVNCPGAITACLLYEITGDRVYLTKAQQIMSWVDGHLLRPDGALDDHQRLDGGLIGWRFTYNQGTYVGASSALYRITGERSYLDKAIRSARYTRDAMCNGAGIFPDHGTGGDGGGFNGVGIRWIAKMVREQGLWREFYPWLKSNADAAWNIRRGDNLSWSNWRAATPGGTLEGFACYGSVVALQVVPPANPADAQVAPDVSWWQKPGSRVAVGSTMNLEARATAGSGGSISAMTITVNGVVQASSTAGTVISAWSPPAAGAYRIVAHAADAAGNVSEKSAVVTAGNPVTPGGVSAGLVAWYRSDSGLVRDQEGKLSVWQDSSGNQRDAAQGFAAMRPELQEEAFGTTDGVRFDGNDFLTSSTGMPLGSYTKVVRFKLDNPAAGNHLLSSPQANASTGDHGLRLNAGKPTIYHSGQTYGASGSIPAGEAAVMIATFDANSLVARVYLNGAQVASGRMAKPNGMSGLQIGAFDGGNHLQGSIGEILLYNRVLSLGDIALLSEVLVDQGQTPLERWKSEHFASGFDGEGDADGDGVPDLAEYALGTDPAVPDAEGHRPGIEISGATLRVAYGLALDRPGVIARLERSEDLSTWAVVADSSLGTAEGFDLRQHERPLPGEGVEKGFYRLKVTEP